MPKRVTNQSVQVHRDGKAIRLKSGVIFDFTKEEIEELRQLAPNALRTPRNEVETIQEVSAEPTKASATKKQNQPADTDGL